jgi:hypothetical protein
VGGLAEARQAFVRAEKNEIPIAARRDADGADIDGSDSQRDILGQPRMRETPSAKIIDSNRAFGYSGAAGTVRSGTRIGD